MVLLISRGCQQRGAAKKPCGKDLIRKRDQRACFREIWAETNPRYSVQKVLQTDRNLVRPIGPESPTRKNAAKYAQAMSFRGASSISG